MRIEQHPHTYAIESYTSHRFELLGEFEILVSAERDGKFYLIWDSSIAEDWFKDDSAPAPLTRIPDPVEIWEFETSEEREAHMREYYSDTLNEDHSGRYTAHRFNKARGYR